MDLIEVPPLDFFGGGGKFKFEKINIPKFSNVLLSWIF
jgi:hypothetical protein